MNKKITKIIIMLFMVMAFLGVSKNADAKDKYITERGVNRNTTIKGISVVAKQYEEAGMYKYKITMKKNGVKKTIAKNTTTDFTTNGKIIYYSVVVKKISSYETKNCIYKYDIKTGKYTKIISGKSYIVCGCSGRYLYCGIDMEADGIKLYAYDLKKKRKKYMTSVVANVLVDGNHVVTSTNAGDAGNYPINVFKLNGTGKKKVCDGGLLSFENNKIYYYVVRESDWKYKVYTCKYNGKQKKAITGWGKKIPKKYGWD